MIEIKITGNSKAELLKNLSELTETLAAPTDWTPEAEPVKEAPKPKPKAKPAPKPEPVPAPEPEPVQEPEAEEPTVTKADVQGTMSKIAAQQPEKKPALRKLLAKFDATKFSELNEADYADFLAGLEAI
jgi:outer membrane biosynthesis protein TonB